MKLKLILSILLCLLWAHSSFAQVAVDAVDFTQSQNNPTSEFFTVGSGSNRQLAVFVFNGCSTGQTAPTAVSVAFAGTPLTQIVADTSVAQENGYLYAWPTGSQPPSGNNAVVVTLTGDVFSVCSTVAQTSIGIISVTGVDQSTTFTSSNHANDGGSGSANPSVTISSSGANDLVIHAACGGSPLSAPTGTSKWNQGNGSTFCNENGGATATGGTTTLSWTMSADGWVDLAASFKAAAGGGGGSGNSSGLKLLGVGK